MQQHPLNIARRHGLIELVMTADIRRLVTDRPAVLFDDLALSAALRGEGYTEGEIAFLFPPARRAAA